MLPRAIAANLDEEWKYIQFKYNDANGRLIESLLRAPLSTLSYIWDITLTEDNRPACRYNSNLTWALTSIENLDFCFFEL